MPTKKKKILSGKGTAALNDPENANSMAPGGFPIVGIGASAGGLETLEAFLRRMAPNAGLAFVIIQHLSPKHKSIMASILAKHTRMTVREIEDGTKIEPNCVYLNPPDKNVAVFNRTLHLLEPVKSGTINMPIDFFFRSLSENEKEKAIGIIVSGTASDGTMGIKAIKGEGGMVMVQDPAAAKYDGMPRSAIETGLVDFILPVEKMPHQLISYIRHPLATSSAKISFSETSDQHQLQKVFALIRSATGHDFSHYKQSTIQRRIERRLAVHQISKLADYILYLQNNRPEVEILFKNIVIGVTSFFRDPEAYQLLDQKVLPKLLEGKKTDDALRFWIAGCSTGEEAYSLAIVVAEVMEKRSQHTPVQIFATDIDEAAIEIARKGVYPSSIAADVPAQRLRQYFTKNNGFFRINKQIRDMIVFSLQNVIKDPPFSRLDLVSCRNLMIYLDSVLQKKLIPMFHYTLNPKGVLLLGTSESIGEFTDLFQPVSSKWKIFRSQEKLSERIIDYSIKALEVPFEGQERIDADSADKLFATTDIQVIAERALLDEYAPSGLLINEKYEILHFIGRTEKFLMPPTGKPSFNILSMARKGLKYRLTTTLHKAVREKKRVTCKGVRVNDNDAFCEVDISVSPLADSGLSRGLLLVVFEDKTPDVAADKSKKQDPAGKTQAPPVQSLEQELQATREYLQAIIEELETSNEEMKSTNEEMQSVNEELQSTNEELETSKEELQSTNEELATVNSELQNKVDELSKASDDMNNLLAATEIASIFLDTRLRIKRYTPAAARIIKLIPADVGRPLGDLKTSFPGVDLAGQGQKVLDDLNTLEAEILAEGEVWYSLKIMPYRTTENVINGVVMTLTDVNRVKQADKIRRLATVLEDSNDAITVQDFKGRILAWNKGAERMYGWTESKALKMNYADLVPADRNKEMRTLVEQIKRGSAVKALKTQRQTKDGGIIDIWLTATALTDEKGQAIEMSTTERDMAWLTEG